MNLRPDWRQCIKALRRGLPAGFLALIIILCGLHGIELRKETGSQMFELMEEVRRLELLPLWPGFEPGLSLSPSSTARTHIFSIFPISRKDFCRSKAGTEFYF